MTILMTAVESLGYSLFGFVLGWMASSWNLRDAS